MGGGISGLTAAVAISKRGHETDLFHTGIETTNSYLAQAGVSFPLLPSDSFESHVNDTLKAGYNLNTLETVWNVISKSTEAYDFLISLGVKFEGSEIEGAHSFPRVFTIKNETGKYITEKLFLRAKEAGVNFIENKNNSLAVSDKKCYGVLSNGKFLDYDATLIASGGYTALFQHFAGSDSCKGLLIGDFLVNGGTARDLEFVQFHPTCYVEKRKILISEAVRGSGAKLLNEKGKRFVSELEKRDIVARAVYDEQRQGKKVFLDAKGVKDIERRFPEIFSSLKAEGLDVRKDVIPVAPVAHYSMGGIYVDSSYRTEIENLYAVGEASCNGFHGANRLASNSLLECLVSSLEVSRTIERDAQKNFGKKIGKIGEKNFDYEPYNPKNIEFLREVMWEHCGIMRSENSLKEGMKKVLGMDLDRRIKVLVSGIFSSALNRRESRGAHFREDYPALDKKLSRSSYFKGGKVRGGKAWI